MRMRIEHQVAVITGASSGIGAELARQLASLGVRVGVTARREEKLRELTLEIQARGGTAIAEPADAMDIQATRNAIHRLVEQLGPVDLLVANAGIGLSTSPSRFSAESIEQMMRVNVIGAAAAIEAVLPSMLERRRGHLVGISSLAGYRGLPTVGGYSASKAALSSLFESLRVDLRTRGITVTTVHPGYVKTPMTEGSTRSQPFLMDVGPAAAVILRGIAARRREVNFPWPMAALVGLASWLPNPVYDRVARVLLGKHR